MSKRKERIQKAASSNIAIFSVIAILVIGIFFAYPVSEGEIVSMFGTKPVIWLQKVLELILSPILIAQLLIILTEDMKSNKKD